VILTIVFMFNHTLLVRTRILPFALAVLLAASACGARAGTGGRPRLTAAF
jgi:hypothetical protein